MKESTAGKRILSIVLLIVGAVFMAAALFMDISKLYVTLGNMISLRSLAIILGSILILIGIIASKKGDAEKQLPAKTFLIVGFILVAIALILMSGTIDIFVDTGTDVGLRGPLLVIGAILVLAGIYFIPTVQHHRGIINFLFLFPLLFTFAVTVVIPMFVGIFYSFTDWNGVSFTQMVGFSNYATMFQEKSFLWSLLITVIFVIINMVLVNVVGFLLALLCTSKLKGVGFFRAAFFLPNLIGGIVLGYVWQFAFSNVLTTILNSNTSILANTGSAFFGIIMVYVWQYAGYIMLIYINGLVTVPNDVLEAAQIDGANPITTLFKIKIPMIASTFTICTFLTLTSAFKQFDVNLALTNGTGSVSSFLGERLSNGTQMLALNIYNTAFARDLYGLAQAKAILFFIILAAVSLVQVRISNSKEVEM